MSTEKSKILDLSMFEKLNTPSPPGLIILTIFFINTVYEVEKHASRPVSSYAAERRENRAFRSKIFYDFLIALPAYQYSNCFYHHGWKGFSYLIAALPVLVIIMTIIFAIYENKINLRKI